MPTNKKQNNNTFNTLNLEQTRKRTYFASSVLVILVLAVAVTVTAVTLAPPRKPKAPGEEVSTAIVFGLPLAQYSSILKNCSLTELQYNNTMTRWESHKMVTLEAPLGTPVLATFAGTVTSVRDHTLYGRQVTIQHRDGLQTVYSNLDKNTLVVQNQNIEKGHQIGVVGQTSNIEFTNTPHLRVEVMKNGKRVDPNDYIDFPIK